MSPRRAALVLRAAALAAACAPTVAGRTARADDGVDSDPVFRAMDAELARARTLAMPNLDAPYHLRAYVTDDASFYVAASFGAVTSQRGGKGASASTEVRVGSADLDDTNFSGDFSFSFGGGFGGSAPLERDLDALRQTLWLSFDGDYKRATEAIAKKRAYLASHDVKERLPDLAPAPVTDLVLPREELTVDRKRWREVVKHVSAVFRDFPFVYSCSATMSQRLSHQYFVSTDPSHHRFADRSASFSISASTQAKDGMPLSLEWDERGRVETDLSDEAALVAKAKELATRLGELADAPTAEDYWGPVLFTGKAAGTFFLETVGGPLSHPRASLGSDQGGRLIDRLGRRIAARGLTARDDPTKKEWNGKPLLGSYPIDDDGVLPEPITLVENGVLKTYYMNRVPTKLVAKTNGHARGSKASTANLFVETSEGRSREDLEKRLLAICKDEDLEYGLVVEDLGGDGGGGSWWSDGDGTVQLPAPSLLYRLHRDGRRELVRGASFKSVPQRILKDIVAMGDDPTLLQSSQFGQSVSVVAPSVLVEEMEVRRPQQENSKPPYCDRPKLGE